MSELPDPIRVDRRATWEVGTWRVIRDVSTRMVSVNGQAGTRLQVSSEVALQLSAAISAAAQWTPEAVVDAEIIDDRPRLDYQLLVETLATVRPAWMTVVASNALAVSLLEALHRRGDVVIVLHGKEWAP